MQRLGLELEHVLHSGSQTAGAVLPELSVTKVYP